MLGFLSLSSASARTRAAISALFLASSSAFFLASASAFSRASFSALRFASSSAFLLASASALAFSSASLRAFSSASAFSRSALCSGDSGSMIDVLPETYPLKSVIRALSVKSLKKMLISSASSTVLFPFPGIPSPSSITVRSLGLTFKSLAIWLTLNIEFDFTAICLVILSVRERRVVFFYEFVVDFFPWSAAGKCE